MAAIAIRPFIYGKELCGPFMAGRGFLGLFVVAINCGILSRHAMILRHYSWSR